MVSDCNGDKGCSEENLEGDVSTSSEDKDGLEKAHSIFS